MMLHFILEISFVVLSIILTINFWIGIGYIFVMIFNDFKNDIHYKEVVLISFTWPLSIMMMVAKQLKVRK